MDQFANLKTCEHLLNPAGPLARTLQAKGPGSG
jgi:hypothetical protein